MPNRVLIPLDGTKRAEAALRSLEQLCSKDDEFVLLMVQKPAGLEPVGYRPGEPIGAALTTPSGAFDGAVTPDVPVMAETRDQSFQSQLDEGKDYLESLAAGLRKDGYSVETEVLVDPRPDRAIIAYAQRMQPAFIVLMRRTHPGLAEMIFGSVASSVVRSEVSPVLFVPSRS